MTFISNPNSAPTSLVALGKSFLLPIKWEVELDDLKDTTHLKKLIIESSHRGSAEMNLTSIHENAGSIPGLTQWVKDPTLPHLWRKPAATAPIQPLAWELPYAVDAALKGQKNKKKLKKNKLRVFGGEKITCPLDEHKLYLLVQFVRCYW